MIRKLLSFIFTIGLVFKLSAQPYVEGNHDKRYSFAQTVMGLDFEYIPSSGKASFLTTDGALQKYTFNDMLRPRFTISGLHFWGHAEFYVTIPFGNLLDRKVSEAVFNYSNSVETGLKYYPWRIEQHQLRPYIGCSLNTVSFQQTIRAESQGAYLLKARTPLHFGCTFNYKNSLLELGGTFYPRNRLQYYVSQTQQAEIKTPPLSFRLAYKFYFDTTTSASKGWKNGYYQQKADEIGATKQLDGLSLAIGLSSIFFVKKSSYNSNDRPFLEQHRSGNVFFDLGLGYYFYKNDIHLNLAYRASSSKLQAYGVSQQIRRKSMAIEAFKFLGDYHGFVPFIGPVLSYENLQANEVENGTTQFDLEKNKLRPGIVFGWDIRPHRLLAWRLRTNLRYFPNLSLEIENGKKLSFDNLEFNFIQFVYYPGVAKRLRQ